MSDPIDRRSLLKSAGILAATAGLPGGISEALAAEGGLRLGPAEPFSFDLLKDLARKRAAAPFQAPLRPAPEIVGKIDYEAWGKITFDTDDAVQANGPGKFPVTFFHLGKFFQKSIEMNVIDGTRARTIIYDHDYFNMPANSVARQLPDGVGFAGFRVQEPRDGKLDWRRNDWVAFLGASYFRAIGELFQYGLSARGIALDTAMPDRTEEFPDFTRIWLGPEDGDTITVQALMEGPSIAGAYKFLMTRGKGVVMDIETALFLRRDIGRFGIAPLTSMYWFSETRKPTAVDWRPEVHDSDGLSMWTGEGERVWRPLNNPPRTTASAFTDTNPRGFGLMQRDRRFENYGDGVFYDRRPSLWVEPVGSWGKGAVQMIEIPTDDEIHDNIVAMWVPEAAATAGSEFNMHYKLHWLADEPFPAPLGRCLATRMGNGGQPGQPRPRGVRKFMIEFKGGPLETVPFGVRPEPVLSASRGSFSYIFSEPVPDGEPGHWRAQFDLTVDGVEPVDMRCYLRAGNEILTETWLYQYHPF
ncbi:MAG: periplasmic glucan biosynthesis protein MdoG [Hyphomicrobiales bacterium]|nr:periplasmic glucan biosynthesis protein MdoG [Hyphomicrobiales bacterium]